QAIAGMLWSKQYYSWDGNAWLDEHGAHPLHRGSHDFRNREWFHLINDDIISMPDKWEYPWYAAWDLAFHTLPISIVDPEPLRYPLALQVPRAAALRVPRPRPGVPGGLSTGRIEHRHVRRQLQLAWARLDAGQRSTNPSPAKLLCLLR